MRWRAQFPAIVKLTERVYGQLVEWLGLPPPRNLRPQSAQARTPGARPGHGGRDLFANDGGSPGHRGLGFRGSEGALLTATTMVSELQRVNETLQEEHTALQRHVGSLEGEMAAMRADLQALRVDMSRGSNDRTLSKIGSKAGGLTRASTHNEPMGTVTVRVLRAIGLVAADKGGTSDPYVVVQSAGGKKEKTSVKKGTVSPLWDETLELSVFDVAAPLLFEVWDHDKIGMNDSLGTGEILLAQCSPGTPTALTIALSTQGTIEVVVTFSPAEPTEEPEEFTAVATAQKKKAYRKAAEEVEAMVAAAKVAEVAETADSTRSSSSRARTLAKGTVAAPEVAEAADSTSGRSIPAGLNQMGSGTAEADSSWSRASTLVGGLTRASTHNEPMGTVTVRVLRAIGLVAADKGGTSDPYVVVQSAGGKKEKTSVKKGTVSPLWDETLELSVFDVAAPLLFEVWDHDKIGMNDSLGTGEILLAQCSPGTPTALTIALSTQGTIEVVVTFSPAEPTEEPEEFTAAAALKQKAYRKAAEEVEAMVAAAQRAEVAAEARSISKGGSFAAARWKLGSSMVGGLGAAAGAGQAVDSTNSSWSRAKTLTGGLTRASTNEQASSSGSIAAGRWKPGNSMVGGLGAAAAAEQAADSTNSSWSRAKTLTGGLARASTNEQAANSGSVAAGRWKLGSSVVGGLARRRSPDR